MATGDITLAIRGSSITAYRSMYNPVPARLAGTESASVSTAATVFGSYLDLATDGTASIGNRHALLYEGQANIPTSMAFSVLLRCQLKNTTGQLISFWEMASPTADAIHRIGLYWNNSGPQIRCAAYNDAAGIHLNNVGGNWSPAIDTWYDVFFATDGSANAGSALIYVNNTAIATLTPTALLDNPRNTKRDCSFAIGYVNGINTSDLWVEECVIFEGKMNPGTITLTNGVGVLSGAARTAGVSAVQFNGSSYTDPGIANVASGVPYTFAGTMQVGTKASGSGGSGTPGLGKLQIY